MKVFQETSAGIPPGTPVSLREHPLQSFLWGDYTAKPGRPYDYRVVALYGKPKNLEIRHDGTLTVATEPVDAGTPTPRTSTAASPAAGPTSNDSAAERPATTTAQTPPTTGCRADLKKPS